MSAAMTHASSPDHWATTTKTYSPDQWMGHLAASIGGYLNNMQTVDRLDDDYRAFLASDMATSGLKRILPPPRKRKKGENT